MSYLVAGLVKAFRFMLVIVLVVYGATALVKYAPGYLSDTRELDSRYAANARNQLAKEASRSTSIWSMVASEVRRAFNGDFGTSRQFEVPVRSLLVDRLPVTAGLLLRSIFLAWMMSVGVVLATTITPVARLFCYLPAAILLALPASVLATLSLLTEMGGPILVLTLILVVRDFTFLDRIFRKVFTAPHVLQARAQGIRWHRVLVFYVGPALAPQLGAIAGLSIVTALGAVIPVEVMFGVPGVGQLAWSAAMNRDLPVLLAVTALMACVMASLTSLSGNWSSLHPETA